MSASMSDAQRRNVEMARRQRELYEREGPWGVHEHFDEFYAPSFEWQPAISELGDRVYRGRKGFAKWISDMEAVASEFQQSEIEVRAVGDAHVLALGKMRLVGKGSGAAFESEYASVYEVEDARATRGWAFLSHADAEKAALEAARELAESKAGDT